MFDSIRPEFFDVLGILTFSFFIVLAIWELKTNKPLPRWIAIIILVIGVAGFLIDSFNVGKFLLKIF